MEKVRFDSVELSPQILKAIEDMGYTEMTEIQAKAIPVVLTGQDVIGRSSTGTGKTAAFGIPAVEILKDSTNRKTQVLAICPTRELAMQISEEVSKYAKYTSNVRLATVYGGESMVNQIRQLKVANFVIGTPGRIMDHMRRGTLKLDELKMVILDEADEMLNMGFLEDIQTILTEAPAERQTLLFSATMPAAIMAITKKFQKNPEVIAVDRGKRTIDTIKQSYYYVPQALKKDALNLLLQMNKNARSVVFCNTKKMVDELSDFLNEHGHKSVGLHGDMKQASRTSVMQSFKNGKLHILIATDVAARGIDVEDVEAVFNFDIPQEYEYYIHRIGRTGRAGKEGAAYTFACNPAQVRRVREIKSYIHTEIVEKMLPTADEFIKQSEAKFNLKVKTALDETNNEQWESSIEKLVEEGYSEKAIACALMGMLIGKDKGMAQVLKAVVPLEKEIRAAQNRDRDRDTKPRGRVEGRSEGRGYSNVPNGVTLKVNVGRKHHIAPNFIVGAVVDATGVSARTIGKIDIFPEYTLFDMPASEAKIVLEKMQGTTIRSNKVSFTTATSQESAIRNNSRDSEKKEFGGFKRSKEYSGTERNKPYIKRK